MDKGLFPVSIFLFPKNSFLKIENQGGHIFTVIYKRKYYFLLDKRLKGNLKERKKMKNQVLEYSIQLAMLRQLLSEKLINKQEYFKIKKHLMKKYKISSDLTC